MIRKRNKNVVICPHTKLFTDLVVCAASCDKKCDLYIKKISLDILERFIAKHPEYMIIGEIMAKEKVVAKKSNEKIYWVVDENKKLTEVKESDIINNPQRYAGKQIWDRPPYKYEVIVALKKIKV